MASVTEAGIIEDWSGSRPEARVGSLGDATLDEVAALATKDPAARAELRKRLGHGPPPRKGKPGG